MAHRSLFTYAVSRPFPLWWFTPVTIVGGIIFIVFFSFLNFVSSSYELIVQNSLDPNATVSGRTLPNRLPSFLTKKVLPTCQPNNIPVNSQFFTNQTALTYTLTAVWQHDEVSLGRVISPSLVYYNNILQYCTITSVTLDLAALDRSGIQIAFGEWGIELRTFITCQTSTQAGIVRFNLTQTYEYVPDTLSIAQLGAFLGTDFLSRNETTKASL